MGREGELRPKGLVTKLRGWLYLVQGYTALEPLEAFSRKVMIRAVSQNEINGNRSHDDGTGSAQEEGKV